MDGDNFMNLGQAFHLITGSKAVKGFGEPFITTFGQQSNEKEEIEVAAYICSLFLSAILEGFPTDRLHTFTRYTRDNFRCFSFDCHIYDRLFSGIPQEMLNAVVLLDRNGHPIVRRCSKQDIFEAFDFYTNR